MIDPLEVMKAEYGLEEVVKLGKDKIVMRFDSYDNSQKFLIDYIDEYLTPKVDTMGFILSEIEGVKEGSKFCLLIPQHMYPAINKYIGEYAGQVGLQDLSCEDVEVK